MIGILYFKPYVYQQTLCAKRLACLGWGVCDDEARVLGRLPVFGSCQVKLIVKRMFVKLVILHSTTHDTKFATQFSCRSFFWCFAGPIHTPWALYRSEDGVSVQVFFLAERDLNRSYPSPVLHIWDTREYRYLYE